MAEEKEKLDRRKAKRGGHKGSVTKKINEAEQTLHLINEKQEVTDDDRSHLNVLYQILEQKQKCYKCTTRRSLICVQWKQ